MNRNVVQRADATADLVDHFAYIGKDSLTVARRFLQAVQKTFNRLADMPRMGRRYESEEPSLQEVRWFRVEGFERYLIFYRPLDEGIEILRVLHGAQDIRGILEAEDFPA